MPRPNKPQNGTILDATKCNNWTMIKRTPGQEKRKRRGGLCIYPGGRKKGNNGNTREIPR